MRVDFSDLTPESIGKPIHELLGAPMTRIDFRWSQKLEPVPIELARLHAHLKDGSGFDYNIPGVGERRVVVRKMSDDGVDVAGFRRASADLMILSEPTDG